MDGVQALSVLKLSTKIWTGLAGYSLSAHKIHGPKGIGLLVCDSKLSLEPIIHGGNQQDGIRSGTLPVPLIMAFAQAIEMAIASQQKTEEHLKKLQEHLIGGLNKLGIPILYNSSYGEFQSPAIVIDLFGF